ncbi:MAG: hypothetical protein AB7T10_01685 [bacterium]
MLLSFNLFFLFLSVYSEPVILSPDANVAGSFDFLNPSRQSYCYDFVRFGAFNNFMTADMTTVLTQANIHIKDFSTGGIILYRPNPLMSTLSTGATAGYSFQAVSFGCMLMLVSDRYSDGVTEIAMKTILSASIESGGFFASTSYGFEERNFIYSFSAGIQREDVKIFLQAHKENSFELTGGISFRFNEKFSMDFAGDTEKRIFYALEAVQLPYRIEYMGMAHQNLPLSNGVFFSLLRGNPHFRLEEVKTVKNKFQLEGKISIKEEISIPLNLNRCSYDEILKLKNISRPVLRRIYVERLINGEYEDYARIDSLPGVGTTTLERIKEQTYIGDEDGEEKKE